MISFNESFSDKFFVPVPKKDSKFFVPVPIPDFLMTYFISVFGVLLISFIGEIKSSLNKSFERLIIDYFFVDKRFGFELICEVDLRSSDVLF